MIIALFMIVLTLVATPSVQSQNFDLDQGDVPTWDALEQFREDPICLRSATARELTILPGIALRTAHRIVTIVSEYRGELSFEFLADSACLSVEQMIVLASCTTLDCRARPFVHSAAARIRNRDGSATMRADIITDIGRIGAVMNAPFASDDTSVSTTTLESSGTSASSIKGWASALLGPAAVHVGAMRMSAGMGLLLGGSGRFGSTVSARSGSITQTPSIRPHTSSYSAGSFNGVAMQYADATITTIAGYSLQPTERNERALIAVAQFQNADVGLLGLGVVRLDYDTPSESRAASVVRGTSLTSGSLFCMKSFRAFDVRGEVVIDNTLASAITVVANGIARRNVPRWSCGVRHFSAEYRAPYASSLSDATSIGNEYGGFIAADVRLHPWTLSATLDVHGSIAPRYGSPLPTRGFDIQLAAISKSFDLRIRYERDTEGWRPPDDAFTRMHARTRLSLRAEASEQVTRNMRVRARIDTRLLLYYNQSTDHAIETGLVETGLVETGLVETGLVRGWAAFVESSWQATSWLSARLRYTLFNAPLLDAATYYVETDAMGAMRTVACSGEGSRVHIAMRINPLSFVTISASVVSELRTSNVSRPLSGLVQLDLRLPVKP